MYVLKMYEMKTKELLKFSTHEVDNDFLQYNTV